jgi:membrane protease YdiL (CAAX protease family)
MILTAAALIVYLIAFPSIDAALNAAAWQVRGRPQPWSDYLAAAHAFADPVGLSASHLSLAALVLAVWAAYRVIHRRRLAWLWSVSPGVRWRYGLAAALAAVLVLGGVTAYLAITGPGLDPPANWPAYAVAIVVTTPLQALGEEVLFRGYLLQALGLIVRRPWFPIAVSAALFGYFHGSQNLWLFLSRFTFGLVAGALVWRTGGLEAGVAAHGVNNLMSFGLALAAGQLVQTRTVAAVSWQLGLRDVVVFAAVGASAWLLARAMRLPRRVPEAVQP